VFPIHLPPLRARGDDVIALANHFLDLTSKNLGRLLSGFSGRSRQLLAAYRWPGNVRELRHVVERAAILSSEPVVEIDDFFLHSAPDGVLPLRTLEEVERGYIRRVLELTGWAVEGADGAAAILGLAPSTLRNRLLKLGLKRGKSLGASAGSEPAG